MKESDTDAKYNSFEKLCTIVAGHRLCNLNINLKETPAR